MRACRTFTRGLRRRSVRAPLPLLGWLELDLVHEHRPPLDLYEIAPVIPHLAHDARAERGNVNVITRIEWHGCGARAVSGASPAISSGARTRMRKASRARLGRRAIALACAAILKHHQSIANVPFVC